MSRLESESADNLEYNWFERDPAKKTIYSSAADGTATTLNFDDNAASPGAVWQILEKGMILLNDRTREHVKITATPTSGAVSVQRKAADSANGGSISQSIVSVNDNDSWTIVTLGKEEGADPVRAAYENPSTLTNYIQTFNSTVELTNAFKNSVLRTDIEGPLTDRRIQALEKISRDIEFAYFLGPRKKEAGSTAGYQYFTGGIYPAIIEAGLSSTNLLNGLADNGGTNCKLSTFNTWLQNVLGFGSDVKLAFCGPTAYASLSTFANTASNGYRIMQSENVFGMNIQTIMTPFGELSLTQHPLFREAIGLQKWMFVLDLPMLVQKNFEKLFLEPNIQNNGSDSYKEQYRAKLGLKLKFANAFGVAYDLSTIVP
jgi:hypothetical protein